MGKRLLLTGATGFVGRRAIKPLLARGYEIAALTSRANPEPVDGVEFVSADLTDPAQIDKAVERAGASHLLHLAWHSVPGGLWQAKENIDWVKHTLDLVEAFVAHGGQRITVSGSCGEYDWTGGLCAEDVTPLRPNTLYGACKHGLQSILTNYCDKIGVELAWGRAFFIYGPGEHPARLAAYVINSLLSGKTAECSHGMQLRDYMHVDDVASGFAALLDSDLIGAYNIATGEAIRVRDLISALAEETGASDLLQLGARPAAAHEPPLIVADMAKTHAALAWRPKFSLAEGAADTVAWFRTELARPN